MLHEERLELGRGDLIAFVLDHFLLAIEDSDITFLVALDDVARPNPAAAGQCFGRILRPLPVALHHLRAESQQLAYLADTKLTPVIESDNLLDRVGDGGADSCVLDAVHRVDVRDGACLRHPVPLEHDRAQGAPGGLGDLRRKGSGAAHDHIEA